MNSVQSKENARTLSSLLGLPEEESIDRLGARVQVTWSASDPSAENLGQFIVEMLRRTFQVVGESASPICEAPWELVINGALPRCLEAKLLHCAIDARSFSCSVEKRPLALVQGQVPKILCLLAACFASAQLANYVLNLPAGRVSSDGVHIEFAEWPGVPESAWSRVTDLGSLQVAGCGAVGNAALYALQFLPIRGQGDLVDPKPVTEGILNRCLWFTNEDVGRAKAEVLQKKVAQAIPQFELRPLTKTIQQARDDIGEFSCMLVGVDSRRVRRSLQMEVPREVFDASTTGIEEVVFHHNLQFDGHACMGCIYVETEAETNFATHIAEALNVTAQDIAQGYITEAASTKIIERYPDLQAGQIVGMAYDSLFRQLCAAGSLTTPELKQVLAPFAFVSQLAGTIVAIELFLRRQNPERVAAFNYWRVNPWRGLFTSLQQMRGMNPDCEVCSKQDYQQLAGAIWG